MYADCLYDWERLAGVWDLYEDKGLNPALVQADLALLSAPLGLVGCGRGKVLHYLQQELGARQVAGYDTSAQMVAAARARGCEQVHQVTPGGALPQQEPARTLMVATGVLDPLEPEESASLLSGLLPCLHAQGQLWLYVFGRFGGSWNFAQALGATGPLGVANHRLFELYEEVQADGFDAVAARRGIAGKGKLQTRVWLHGIGKFIASVARHQASDAGQALATVRRITPRTVRHFSEEEIGQLLTTAGLEATSTHRFESHGVLRVIARRQTPPGSHAAL